MFIKSDYMNVNWYIKYKNTIISMQIKSITLYFFNYIIFFKYLVLFKLTIIIDLLWIKKFSDD